MTKRCKKGYYYCSTSKKCRKYSVFSSRSLAKDGENDNEESSETTNGGENGGGMSESYLEEKGGTLHNWFGKSKSKGGKKGWVQSDGSPCANEKGETKTPKCYSSRRLAGLKRTEEGRKKIRSADARKSREDPGQQQKSGAAKPTYSRTFKDKKDYKKHKSGDYTKEGFEMQEARDVKGKGSGKKDACYHKVKANSKVWPSAYASGRLVQCRKKGASNWNVKTKKEEFSNWRSDLNKLDENIFHSFQPEGQVVEGRYSGGGGLRPTDRIKMGDGSLKSLKDIDAKLKEKNTKKEEFFNWRDDFIPTEYETVDIIKPDPIISEGQKCWKGYEKKGTKKMFGKTYNNCVKKEEVEIQEAIPGYEKRDAKIKAAKDLTGRNKIEALKAAAKIPVKLADEFSDWRAELAIEEDWQKVNKKDKTDGMSPAAVKAYRRENPGSKLKTAVTGNPKKGSKDAKRRKSYCARSKGQQDMHNIDCSKTPDKPVCKARRRWKC